MKQPQLENALFSFSGTAEANAFRQLIWRRLHALRRMRAAFQSQIRGRSFEGSHMQKDFASILLHAFDDAGFDVARFNGQAFLRSPTADAYEVFVRRKDDSAWHWFPLCFPATPLDLESAWRIVQRAERWLRSWELG